MSTELEAINTPPVILNNHVQAFHIVYKEIIGYNGAYRVGFDGSVWTKKVHLGWGKWVIGTEKDWSLLSRCFNTYGYPQVVLCRNGKAKTCRVHKVVAETFIGPCPAGLEVCHEDGDRLNPHLCNLRYDTRENNIDDRIKHGVDSSGERHGNAFLTWKIVDKMREEYAAGGLTQEMLAANYNTTRATVSRIVNNRIWIRH